MYAYFAINKKYIVSMHYCSSLSLAAFVWFSNSDQSPFQIKVCNVVNHIVDSLFIVYTNLTKTFKNLYGKKSKKQNQSRWKKLAGNFVINIGYLGSHPANQIEGHELTVV